MTRRLARRPAPDHALQDWYFFGYGHDYKAALAEYTRFGGPVPLIPRYVLGAWWSRYWAYSDQDLQDLVREFEAHDLPLDVLVVDMDWHTPHSWTGYTWNRELFPDPPAFLRWVHEQGPARDPQPAPRRGRAGLRGGLSPLRPGHGRRPGQRRGGPLPHHRPALCRSTTSTCCTTRWKTTASISGGWTGSRAKPPRCRASTRCPGSTTCTLPTRRGAGSGPCSTAAGAGWATTATPSAFPATPIVGWPALQFQPYLTATAANVAYGWWSHDIGGHMGGATEPELYARWVQFGALSPMPAPARHQGPPRRAPPLGLSRRGVPGGQGGLPLALPAGALPLHPGPRRPRHRPGALPAHVLRAPRGRRRLRRPLPVLPGRADDRRAHRPSRRSRDRPGGHRRLAARGRRGSSITTRETFTGPRWVRLVGDLDRVPMLVQAGAILPLAGATDSRHYRASWSCRCSPARRAASASTRTTA